MSIKLVPFKKSVNIEAKALLGQVGQDISNRYIYLIIEGLARPYVRIRTRIGIVGHFGHWSCPLSLEAL